MSENNENIIKSAFSFYDSGLEFIKGDEKNNLTINVWNISKGNSLNSLKSQQIAIQEEYEPYGAGEKRLKQRTFYKKPNGFPEVAYSEVFQYKDSNLSTPKESGISKLIDSEEKTIGYRYYRNGINNSPIDSNNFVTIVEYSDGQYHPIQGTGSYEGDLEIIHSIFRENYKEGAGYEISGSRLKTLGISAIAKHFSQNIYVFSPGEQLKDDYYLANKERKKSIITNRATNEKSIHTPTCFNTESDYILEGEPEYKLSKFDSVFVNKGISKNNKIILFPLSFALHATLYLINNKSNPTTQHLIDFSLGHCEKNKDGTAVSVNRDYFGKDTDNITLLNKFPMQINGTCNFYADAVLSVIANPSNRYDSMENIVEDCVNGTMWLKVMAEMGKTFDLDPDYPTVKEFSGEDDALNASNTSKYVVFKKNRIFFGISKECYNNKFVDMEALIKCLQTNQQTNVVTSLDDIINREPLEQKLSKQLELQKEIKKAQRMMYLLNKSIKQFNTLDKILDKKNENEEDEFFDKNIYPNYNYYNEFNSWCQSFKREHKDDLDNFIKYLSSIKAERLEEGVQELLNKVPNIDNIRPIINDEYYRTFETNTKGFLDKIKFSVVESVSDELLEDPELQNVLEQLEILDESLSLQKINETAKKIDHELLDIKNFQSKEISKTTMVALKANKKPSSQPLPSKHLSFTQRENLRRQQSGSAPARLGY